MTYGPTRLALASNVTTCDVVTPGVPTTLSSVFAAGAWAAGVPSMNHVDPRFHGRLSLDFKTSIPDEVLESLPSRSLAFGVSADYVFYLLGVRVRT